MRVKKKKGGKTIKKENSACRLKLVGTTTKNGGRVFAITRGYNIFTKY